MTYPDCIRSHHPAYCRGWKTEKENWLYKGRSDQIRQAQP